MKPWPEPTLPEDEPLDESGRKRFSDYRLTPVINALFDRLSSWLNTPVKQRATPSRIGLFGSLGQGKSTVVCCVLEKLADEQSTWQRIKTLIWGPRIASFDVSFFKANDLEWRFLTAVLWRRIIKNLLPAILLLALELAVLLVLIVLYTRWILPQCPVGWVPSIRWVLDVLLYPLICLFVAILIILPTIKILFKALGKTKPHNPAKDLYLSARDLLVQKTAVFMLALPDVVVVDDLDRATVEQQRAFLRSITRFSREMGFVVVICMDESDLLAAPPNPENPEELLRKTLNAELRIPDRTREDVALLVMSCTREFIRDNPDLPQKPALQSVQFVADLTRVLLLSQAASAVSPRKVRRLLMRVVLQAMQLKVTATDDLAALMRMDGLLQLAPVLRRNMDGLRHVLEANRTSGIQKLLTVAKVPEEQHPQLEQFFNRTRMMQPSMHDGWFRLLGGLAMIKEGSSKAPVPWSAPWEISSSGHTFFRLFLEAIELDAAGYEHDLSLHLETVPATGTERYKFVLPGGAEVNFAVDDLPIGYRGVERNDYIAQSWVLWVCALASALPIQKTALFERAYRWIGVGTTFSAMLRDLFWRECMADTDLWSGEDETSRSIHYLWWDRARSEVSLPRIDRFFTHLLLPVGFADAWSVLVQPGGARDGRKALHWWRGVTPDIAATRLQSTTDIDFVSTIWPAPEPETQDATGWIKVLTQHFQALNILNAVKGQIQLSPAPLLYAWRRAQLFLDVGQCLDLLFCLACDDKAQQGSRWSIRAVEPWLDVLDETRRIELKAWVESPTAEHDGMQTTERRLTLLLLSGMRNWMSADVISLMQGLPKKELQEIRSRLADKNISPVWLVV